jgi:hypothetical protein
VRREDHVVQKDAEREHVGARLQLKKWEGNKTSGLIKQKNEPIFGVNEKGNYFKNILN